jgi:hypothetical protein
MKSKNGGHKLITLAGEKMRSSREAIIKPTNQHADLSFEKHQHEKTKDS